MVKFGGGRSGDNYSVWDLMVWNISQSETVFHDLSPSWNDLMLLILCISF